MPNLALARSSAETIVPHRYTAPSPKIGINQLQETTMTEKMGRARPKYRTLAVAVGIFVTFSSPAPAEELAMTVVRPPAPPSAVRVSPVRCEGYERVQCQQQARRCAKSGEKLASCNASYRACLTACGG